MLKKLAITVGVAHLLIVICLVVHHFATRRLKPVRPIVVRTIIPQAPKPVILSASAPPPSAKKVSPPAPIKKKAPTPKCKATLQNQDAPRREGIDDASLGASKSKCKAALHPEPAPQPTLLKEIAESLETLNTEAAQSRSKLTVPTKIKPKTEIAQSSMTADPTYAEFLVAFLQEALDLPEYGEVRAKIEIDPFGRLVRCEILEAKSRINAEFLRNRLPDLTFPCLNDMQVFTITFRNVEIR